VNCGDKKDRENAASIGPAWTCEKFFSEGDGVGFYAFGHDRKMTEKWDFRAFGDGKAGGRGRGQSGEKPAKSAVGVADSRNELRDLCRSSDRGRLMAAIPTPVDSGSVMAARPQMPCGTGVASGGDRIFQATAPVISIR